MAKYQEWLTADGLARIESWARDGLTDKQIATNIGIGESTFTMWKKKYSSIVDALKKGKRPIDFEVENLLLKRARGYDYEESETYIKEVNGVQTKTIKKIKRHALPDVSAIIFWLKNRKPDAWRRMSVEYADKIAAETSKLEAETKMLQFEIDKLEAGGQVNDLLEALIAARQAGDSNDDD